MASPEKWRRKQEEDRTKYYIPFLVLWIAVSAGALLVLLPSRDTTVCTVGSNETISTIFHTATIFTGEDPAYVEALAVLSSGRIACAGSLEALSAAASPSTEYIDLQHQYVTPGLMDPHVHILSGGLSLHTPDLSTVQSAEELIDIMRNACEKEEEGDWVQGIGWNEVTWGGPSPHRTWLDKACPHNPVAIHRMCWHKAVVSSSAARLAGISDKTKDPPGGVIYRDENGITGLLAESAMDLVKTIIPSPSLDAKRQLVKDASRYLLSQGVTMAHDMGAVPTNESEAFENLKEVYIHLAEKGELPIRLFAFTPLSGWKRLATFVEDHGHSTSDKHVFWGGLKEFADGSLGSQTALFHEPYLQQPEEQATNGVRTIQKQALAELVIGADKAGLQVAVHAIGDLAVDDVLDVFERARVENEASRKNPRPRHRIEHAQHLSHPSVAQRFANLGIHAVANPLHLLPDKRVLKLRLGEERAGPGRSYALQTLIEAGVQVSFASDFPVVKSDPLLGIFSAFYRRDFGESEPYVESESVSLEEALRSTTIQAAKLAGLEHDLGSLRFGKFADFVVMSSDPLYMSSQFGPPKVLATYIGGKLVYADSNCQLG